MTMSAQSELRHDRLAAPPGLALPQGTASEMRCAFELGPTVQIIASGTYS